MSLLNAALRKKEKENQQSDITAIFSDSEKVQKKSKLWIYGLSACLALALGLAVLFGLNLLSTLKRKPPILSFSQIQTAQQNIGPAETTSLTKDILALEPLKATVTLKTNRPMEMTPQSSEQVEEPALPKKIILKPEKSIEKTKAVSPKRLLKTKDDALSVPPKPNKPDSSRLFYEKAVRYHRQNRLEEAILMYQQVLSKNPLDTNALFNLAAAYLQNRDFSMALPILNDLSEKDPNNPQVLLNLAIAKMGLGEPEFAISLLDKAQQLNGGSTFELYFHKAVALSQLGRLDEAKRFYERAGKIHPDHSGLLFNLAVLYDKMEQYKEALQYYRAFLAQKSLGFEKDKEALERRVLILSGFVEKQ
jgi:tetratricopeptide (TPR) repeat protein